MNIVLWIVILLLATVAWNTGLWWAWGAVIYMAIGMVIAEKHLASGKCGAKGPQSTLITVMLLWPIVVTHR